MAHRLTQQAGDLARLLSWTLLLAVGLMAVDRWLMGAPELPSWTGRRRPERRAWCRRPRSLPRATCRTGSYGRQRGFLYRTSGEGVWFVLADRDSGDLVLLVGVATEQDRDAPAELGLPTACLRIGADCADGWSWHSRRLADGRLITLLTFHRTAASTAHSAGNERKPRRWIAPQSTFVIPTRIAKCTSFERLCISSLSMRLARCAMAVLTAMVRAWATCLLLYPSATSFRT